MKVAYSSYRGEPPKDVCDSLGEALYIITSTYERVGYQNRVTNFDVEQIQYGARNFASYLRDEQFSPSLSGIFPNREKIDRVAALSDKLSDKCDRALRLLERKQTKSR